MKATESIFPKQGFYTATISDIAKETKVSEATIYEYFSAKEELFFSIPALTTHQHEIKNRNILKYTPGAANQLSILIYCHLELYADYANIVMKSSKIF